MAKKTTTAIVTEPELTQLSGGHYVDWAAVAGGSILAAAISIVLIQFGGAIGLSADGFEAERGDLDPVGLCVQAETVRNRQPGMTERGEIGRLRAEAAGIGRLRGGKRNDELFHDCLKNMRGRGP